MSLVLDGVKFMVVGGDQRDIQPFCQCQCKGISKGDSLFHCNDIDPLHALIMGISTECKREGEGVGPRRLGCPEEQ